MTVKEKQIKGLMEKLESLNSSNGVALMNAKQYTSSKSSVRSKNHDILEGKLRDENQKLIAEV